MGMPFKMSTWRKGDQKALESATEVHKFPCCLLIGASDAGSWHGAVLHCAPFQLPASETSINKQEKTVGGMFRCCIWGIWMLLYMGYYVCFSTNDQCDNHMRANCACLIAAWVWLFNALWYWRSRSGPWVGSD